MTKELQVISVLGLTPESEIVRRDFRNSYEIVNEGEEVIVECDGLRKHAVVELVDGYLVIFRIKD
jgi:hypothetical protein